MGIFYKNLQNFTKMYTFFKNKYKTLYISYIKVTLGNKNIYFQQMNFNHME